MHGGHIGIHFEKNQFTRKVTVRKSASKYVNLLLNLVIFCMVAMLAAILKTKFTKMFVRSSTYCRKQLCQSMRV